VRAVRKEIKSRVLSTARSKCGSTVFLKGYLLFQHNSWCSEAPIFPKNYASMIRQGLHPALSSGSCTNAVCLEIPVHYTCTLHHITHVHYNIHHTTSQHIHYNVSHRYTIPCYTCTLHCVSHIHYTHRFTYGHYTASHTVVCLPFFQMTTRILFACSSTLSQQPQKTGIACPLVPKDYRCVVFESLHNLSHPSICATQQLLTKHCLAKHQGWCTQVDLHMYVSSARSRKSIVTPSHPFLHLPQLVPHSHWHCWTSPQRLLPAPLRWEDIPKSDPHFGQQTLIQ